MKLLRTKKAKLNFVKAAFACCFCMMLETPFIGEQFGLPSSFSDVYLDDVHIGAVRDPANVEKLLLDARLQLAKEQKKMMLADVECRYEPVKKPISRSLSDEELYEKLYEYLKNDSEEIQRAYLMKIGTYTVYLNSIDDIYQVLESAKEKYDPENRFQVNIIADFEREINMYTAELISSDIRIQDVEQVGVKVSEIPIFDVQSKPEEETQEPSEEPVEEPSEEPAEEPSEGAAEAGKDGMQAMYFGEKVEISEAYVSSELVTSPEEASEQITKENQKKGIYEVQSGDTISTIANNHGLYVKELLALNEGLGEDTMLHIGDELVITVPTPELTVMTVEQTTYEEEYFGEVEYVYNDSWYTTKSEVLREEEPGYHEITALVTKKNGEEQSREIVSESVLKEPVSKKIEIGTQTPPTFIKPISGGRQTSAFGRRKAPKKGASTNHKGVDWATPKGTAVMASSGGTVAMAGWQGSYGYVVYINHPDGKQTRYAHLSKILVSSGQTVKQGQKIALSGNTGRSTGPHLHFELRVNGTPVNPYKYI